MRRGKGLWHCHRWLIAGLICILACNVSFRAVAQSVLKLAVDPEVKEGIVFIPSELHDGIKISAEISGKWKQLNWKYSGPGRFRNTEFGILYLPPEELEVSLAYVELTATLITNKGIQIEEKLKWTLMPQPATPSPSPTPTATPFPTATPTVTPSPTPTITATPSPSPEPEATATMTPSPEPTATPSPKPTATPTSTPSPSPEPTVTPSPTPTSTPTMPPSPTPEAEATLENAQESEPRVEATPVPSLTELEKHLRAAQRYLGQKAYTTPKGKNAFDEYKTVLQLDPTNRQARQGMYKILRQYQYWGDGEYKKGRLKKARQAYSRYLMVADYLLESFDDVELQQDVQTIKERLQ